MSRALTQQQQAPVAPGNQAGEHPNYLTPAGLARLRGRLAEVQARLTALRQGTEESVMADARAELEREWRWLSTRVASAIEVDPGQQPRDRVGFGAWVTVDSKEGEQRYRLVGEDEADAERHQVSYVSPLAQALLGLRVGEEAIWQRPSGELRLEILRIDYED